MICPDENPLLGLVSLIAPALVVGNVVAIPSEPFPLSATDLYQAETRDLPNGVLILSPPSTPRWPNISLAGHMDLDAVWYFGLPDSPLVEKASATNLKRTWVNYDLRPRLDRSNAG